jgi:hypothetical protein
MRTLIFLLLSFAAQAQPMYSNVNYQFQNISSNTIPFASPMNRRQGILNGADFNMPAGNITAIWVRGRSSIQTPPYTISIPLVQIGLGTTSADTFVQNQAWLPTQTVYQQTNFQDTASVFDPHIGGDGYWFKFQLQTPFFWDGIQNLVIDETTNGANANTGFNIQYQPMYAQLPGRSLINYSTQPTGMVQNFNLLVGFDMQAPLNPTISLSYNFKSSNLVQLKWIAKGDAQLQRSADGVAFKTIAITDKHYTDTITCSAYYRVRQGNSYSNIIQVQQPNYRLCKPERSVMDLYGRKVSSDYSELPEGMYFVTEGGETKRIYLVR